MRRREFLNLAAAGGAGLMFDAVASAQVASAGTRPNLVFFFPDEMRADSIASYGNPVTKTPNIDAFAAQGALFKEAHVQNPVCAQSRCSMLTGWPTSVRGHRSLFYLLRQNEPNMFRYLKQAGYDVYWFGKNDALAPESFRDSVTAWRGPQAVGAGVMTGTHTGPTTMLMPGGGDRRETSDYTMLKAAFDVLQRREQDRPFCIFLPTIQPHPPYRAPDGFAGMYDKIELPELPRHGLRRKPAFHDAIRKSYGLADLPESEFIKVRKTYYEQVSYTDWLLGELLETIDRTGHGSDTAVIMSSDHGDYAGDYGLVEKWPAGLESCLTHVPLITRVPGGKSGVVSNEMVELFDVMPTMLELAGTRATHTNFARSLLPQVHGQAGDPHRAAFSEGGYNVYEPQAFEPHLGGLYGPKTQLQNDKPELIERVASIKTKQFNFIARPSGQSELYDRSKDPAETNNLFGEHAHAPVVEQLQQRLMNWYINTSGVPEEKRDSRDMPTFDPVTPFSDVTSRAATLLDGD